MPSETSSDRYVGRARAVRGGGAAALLVLVLMVATEPLLPIVWDEGFTIIRLAQVRGWLVAVRDPELFAARGNRRGFGVAMDVRVLPPKASEINTRSKLFSHQVITWFWPFARDEPHGHPPFYPARRDGGDRRGKGLHLARSPARRVFLMSPDDRSLNGDGKHCINQSSSKSVSADSSRSDGVPGTSPALAGAVEAGVGGEEAPLPPSILAVAPW
jgi:hypothetical protein